jgi:hypothetical protein
MLKVCKNGVYIDDKCFKGDIPFKEFHTIQICALPLPFDLSDLKAEELHILPLDFRNLGDPFLPRNVKRVCIQQAKRIQSFTGTPWVHVREVMYLRDLPLKDMTKWFPNMEEYTGYSINLVHGLKYYRIVDDDYPLVKIQALCRRNPKASVNVTSLPCYCIVEQWMRLYQQNPHLRGEDSQIDK